MKRLVKMIAIGAVTLAAAMSSAQALNVKSPGIGLRTGPGTNYAVTRTIPAGKQLTIGVCNPVWCHVKDGRNQGWIQTARILPNYAKNAKQGHPSRYYNTQKASYGGGGGGGGGGGNGKTASLTIRIRIVKPEKLERGKTNIQHINVNKIPAKHLIR